MLLDKGATATNKMNNKSKHLRKATPSLLCYTVKEEAYARDAMSHSYWHLNSPSTFLSYSWLMDDLLHNYNERFFYLTLQNLKICSDMWVGQVRLRFELLLRIVV